MQDRKINKFDRLVKEKLESGVPEVSKDLWGKISQELEQIDQAKPSMPRTAFMRSWKSLISVAAMLLLAITVGVILNKQQNPDETIQLSQSKPAESLKNSSNEAKPIVTDASALEPSSVAMNDDQPTAEVQTIIYEEDSAWKGTKRVEQEPSYHVANDITVSEDSVFNRSNTELQYAFTEEIELDPVLNTENSFVNTIVTSEVKGVELASSSRVNDVITERLSVSSILNFVVSRMDKREEKFLKFSNDQEGSIRVDINLVANRK